MSARAALRSGGLVLRPRSAQAPMEAIRTAVLPSIALFPLLQHTGEPAERLVSPGDRVREGMIIARAAGRLSASVHASIPGVVTSCRPVLLPNGVESEAIAVKLDGEFERLGRPLLSAVEGAGLERSELLRRIADCGLVALDSTALPLAVRWTVPRGKRVERLIVSTLDDEPFLTVESRVSIDRKEALAEGLTLAARVLAPRSIVFACEPAIGDRAELAEVARLLEAAAAAAGTAFSRVTVGNTYPRGEHRALARAANGGELPPGSSLSDLGVFVTNASTLVAVRDAILGGKPLIERCVTVAGGAIAEAATLRVRIGTPVRDLIEECGGFRETPERIVVGGPFSGSIVYDLDSPVLKNTAAILVLTKREVGSGEPSACINCGRCVTACPEELNPALLFREIEHQRYERAAQLGLLDCSECGSCSYVCPSHLPLLPAMRIGKRALWRTEERE